MAQKRTGLEIKLPLYTLGEEIFHAISHGVGAALSIVALILMAAKASGLKQLLTVSDFGTAMILLYTISCIYHSLSRRTEGKKVLRVIDHCNVYLLVWGTYMPVALLGVGGALGWTLFAVTGLLTVTGITLTAISVDRFKVLQVVCNLLIGWSILMGFPSLVTTVGHTGILYMVLGGAAYTVGAVLYGLGSRKRYMHSVFHIFCMLGTFCHFWAIYAYLL